MISDSFRVYDEEQFAASCEKDLCLAANKNGKPEGFVLVQRENDRTLRLSYLYSKNPKALLSVLNSLYEILEEYAYDPQIVYFEPVTEESEHLAEKLFPGAKKEAIYEIEL